MYYYDAAARRGQYPFDQELGVNSEISAGVTRMLVKLCVRLPYAEAVTVHGELTRVDVSVSTAWQRTQAAGRRARPAMAPIPTQQTTHADAVCMGISMDGCMAHVREEGWKEIKIGMVFEVETSPRIKINRHRQLNKPNEPIEAVHAHHASYVMHLGGPEGLGVKLVTEAQSRRWSNTYQSVVIGDGAAWIWNLATHDYASAAHIVDWYHAKQHLCVASTLIYPDLPDKAATWVEAHAVLLYAGQALQIAERLFRAAALAQPDLKAKLDSEAGYFFSNHERMQYRDFELAHLPIGSGMVESAAKQAKHRLSAAGMRWSRPGLENILPLRAALMSDSFDLFWQKICPA